jgi:hypothetical protein
MFKHSCERRFYCTYLLRLTRIITVQEIKFLSDKLNESVNFSCYRYLEKTEEHTVFLIIGVCILLRVYPVMLINHRTQRCFLVLIFIVHLHCMFRPLIGGHLEVICDLSDASAVVM